MKKVLFIDRDGTLALEPEGYQLDSFEKLDFYPGAFTYLGKIAKELNFELVMITNQDGLGTASFPEETFWPVQHFLLRAFQNEGIEFNEVLIDKSLPQDNAPTRKPRTGMLTSYLGNPEYDLSKSYVIGDRLTDMELAKNIGCKGLFLANDPHLGEGELETKASLPIVLNTTSWKEIYSFLKLDQRQVSYERKTKETAIHLELNIDGTGKSEITTGIVFFDHMLDQLARHGGMDIRLSVKGDLEVDEHHTIEDTAIALGEAFSQALSNKLGMERYGFCLPMDDCLAQVAIDFGGRSW